jgi:hypothetical protein
MHAGGDSVVSLSYEIMDVALYHPHARQIGKELNGMMATQKAISGMFPRLRIFALSCGLTFFSEEAFMAKTTRPTISDVAKAAKRVNQHFTLSERRKAPAVRRPAGAN